MSETETFVDLTFYPPIDTDEYVSKVPESVKQRMTALGKGTNAEKSTDDRFKLLIKAFCCDYTHSLHKNYLEIYWGALREELVKYYERN